MEKNKEHKFTQGPWKELYTRIDDARGYQICHLDLHGKNEEEMCANRKLITAAPDLLAVLEELRYAISFRAAAFAAGNTEEQVFANDKMWQAHEKAGEAIAKALGTLQK